MMNFNYTKSFIISIVIFILGCDTNENYSTNDPNIIIIYTDDLGYGDVSAYQKGTLKTPNIDKLANEGIRFNYGYASSATCSFWRRSTTPRSCCS